MGDLLRIGSSRKNDAVDRLCSRPYAKWSFRIVDVITLMFESVHQSVLLSLFALDSAIRFYIWGYFYGVFVFPGSWYRGGASQKFVCR